MPSNTVFLPVPVCLGTRPSHAANSRPDLNGFGLPMVATAAVAVRSPTPGMAAIALHAWSEAAQLVALELAYPLCQMAQVRLFVRRTTTIGGGQPAADGNREKLLGVPESATPLALWIRMTIIYDVIHVIIVLPS
jgi:hypothetical protein